MFGDRKIALGYAPTRRDSFPDPKDALIVKNRIRNRMNEIVGKLKNVELVDIDWLNEEGLLVENEDVAKVEAYFKKAGVDAIFMPHCNFGQEEVVGKLGKAMNKPFLLWGPRDDTPPEGFALRQTDTQCGLFGSSRALIRYGVPFTYIENCWLNDSVLEKEFEDFIRVSSVAKAFRKMRIGQISVRPKQFLSVKINESELLEKFGIEVVPIVGTEILSLVKDILEKDKDSVKEIVDDIKGKVNCSAMQDEQLDKIAALELAFMEAARKYGCSALASECWTLFASTLGIKTCFAFGDATDRGLPISCETDVHGAITSVLLTAAARWETPNFLADVTIRHPYNDNAELLWHCGPFPKSLAKEGSNPALVDCQGQWELKGGDVTLARFDADRGKYKLFADQARGVEGPSTNGNYLWIETNNWVKWEKKLIYGPYIHHVSAIHGKYANILHDACRYMNGVEPDSVE